jgi:hypothetical protein
MIDAPRATEERRVEQLEAHLGDRLVKLPEPSLEEYIPENVYEAANLDRDVELARIQAASNIAEKRTIKREISESLAEALTVELIAELPELKRTAELAMDTAAN